MPSHRLQKITLNNLDILGYSIAGEETVVALPQLDVCFDIGKAPDQVIPINHVLLSHGHIDHAAGFAYYLSHRQFDGQSPGTVIAPGNLVDPIRKVLESWGRLDGNRVPGTIVGLKPGDEYPIKPNLFVRAFPTHHCEGSLGYTVIERRKKLKPEYRRLTGPQIVALKKQGVQIDDPLESPIVTYLGDTQRLDFDRLGYVKHSQILITECTFFSDEHLGRAKAGRHIHVHELQGLLERLQNEHVVLIHTTQRTGLRECQRLLKQHLSDALAARVTFLMDPGR